MRLSRLDLTRYGLFTDRRIDFGDRTPGRPDLHLVYGPNESGKSTTLSAILDLLFGIEVQSRYDFLHEYKSMAVGARIETEAGSWEAVRVKRRNDSLVDPATNPIDDAFLTTALVGLDRAGYRMMFSLDDATLEEGGDAILASRGDLGQVLFSATAGLSELHDTLVSITGAADDFHKPRGRTGELARLKAQLADLKKRREQVDTVATQHARLVSELSDARLAHVAEREARVAAKAHVASLRGVASALPHFAVVASARDGLADLASLSEVPSSWASELPALVREEVELATRLEGAEHDVARLVGRVDGIVVDSAALSAEREVGLFPALLSRHSDATDALPGARVSLRAEQDVLGEILRGLGRSEVANPRDLLLPSPILALLADLTGTRSGVVEALRKAGEDVVAAEAAVATAREELGVLAVDEGSAATVLLVRSALGAARAGGHEALVAAARRDAEKARSQLAAALLALRPWEGDLDGLAAMVTPEPADVEAWRVGLDAAEAETADAAGEASTLVGDRARLRAEADAASAVVGAACEDHDAVRGQRERAWATHRATLDAASADSFERTMRRDDAVTSARLGHEAELSRLRQLRERVDATTAGIEVATRAGDRALAAAANVRSRMADAAAAAGGAWDPAATPTWLLGWLTRRSEALALGPTLAEVEAKLRSAQGAAEAARTALAGALAAATVPHDARGGLDGLGAAADAFLEGAADLVGRRRRLAELERDFEARRRSWEGARRGDEAWSGEWARACGRCWFGKGDVVPATAEVRAILDVLSRLGPRIAECDRLAAEVLRLERDAAALADEVARVARLVPHVDVTGPPSEAALRLESAVRGAVAARDDLAAAAKALDEARASKRALVEAASALECRKRPMTSLFSVDTLAEVEVALASVARRRELRSQVERAERDVVEALGAASFAEAEARLVDLDREDLKVRLSEAEVAEEECERAEAEAHAALRLAADRVDAVGGDEEVARIAEARSTVLVEIEEKVARYVRLRLGVLAAERAIDLFRDEHRSTLMALASDAFRVLTGGRYARLTSRSERAGETLIALTDAGASRTAAGLSKGTRFQLYLALRIAAYEKYVRTRPSVPFVADDILETFDDGRTEEALMAFTRMAERGQVIYLTHHPHVCRIASKVCPGVRIHELASLPTE